MIKDINLLNETSRSNDMLESDAVIKAFDYRINNLPNQSVIALVGPYGVGKSTMLNLIKESHQEQCWIEFDAWKYPNRENLWEGFVLDIADQIGVAKQVKKRIAGKSLKSPLIDIGTDILSLISDKFEGLQIADKLSDFFKKSPATRVFDLQNILKDLLLNQEKETFIIIEDIDRSGDSGIYFLETLKQFLRLYNLEKKIIIIVPIANENYYKNLESYIKSIDYFDFWELKKINLSKFVDCIFEEELFTGELRLGNNKLIWSGVNRRLQIISFLESVFKDFPQTNLRLIKLILRKAEIVYQKQVKDGHEPDFRITLCIECAKYFKSDYESNKTYFETFKEGGVVNTGNIFSSMMYVCLHNVGSIYRNKSNSQGEMENERIISDKHFKFIERTGPNFPSYPWVPASHFDANDYYGITNFYLNY